MKKRYAREKELDGRVLPSGRDCVRVAPAVSAKYHRRRGDRRARYGRLSRRDCAAVPYACKAAGVLEDARADAAAAGLKKAAR